MMEETAVCQIKYAQQTKRMVVFAMKTAPIQRLGEGTILVTTGTILQNATLMVAIAV